MISQKIVQQELKRKGGVRFAKTREEMVRILDTCVNSLPFASASLKSIAKEIGAARKYAPEADRLYKLFVEIKKLRDDYKSGNVE